MSLLLTNHTAQIEPGQQYDRVPLSLSLSQWLPALQASIYMYVISEICILTSSIAWSLIDPGGMVCDGLRWWVMVGDGG